MMRKRKENDTAKKKSAAVLHESVEEASQDKVSPKSISTSEPTQNTSFIWKLLKIMKYVFFFVLIPPFLNYVALMGESEKLKPEGQLYDVGNGQLMYLGCMGSGRPTVILDAPTGMSSDVWSLIQPQLAKITRVCVYDRAGIGFSQRPVNSSNNEPGINYEKNDISRWEVYTVERMADDLHRLITWSSEQPRPLILVGAELGSLVSRFYAHLYESEVSDLVLVDPLVEDIFTHDNGIWTQFWFQHLIPSFQSLQLAAATGLTRLALLVGLMDQPILGQNVSELVKIRQKHLLCHPRHMSSVVDEHFFINETFAQIGILQKIKPVPENVSITVITGNYYDEQLPSALNKAWAKSQEHLVSRIYPRSKHIVVNGADHMKVFASAVDIVNPVKRLVKQWRTNNKEERVKAMR